MGILVYMMLVSFVSNPELWQEPKAEPTWMQWLLSNKKKRVNSGWVLLYSRHEIGECLQNLGNLTINPLVSFASIQVLDVSFLRCAFFSTTRCGGGVFFLCCGQLFP